MREWFLVPGDPLALSMAADFRLCTPDYANDHIWELETGEGDPPALAVHTTYGLRVRSMRLFPRFSLGGRTITNPAAFSHPLSVHQFFPNFLALKYSPFTDLDITAEYWIPDSHSLAGRFGIANTGAGSVSLGLEMCGQLIPLDGQGLTPRVMSSVNVLAGHCADLAPVLFFTGGPQPGSGPYPSLAIDLPLAPGEVRNLTWVQAALGTQDASLELARKTAARPWEAERARIEMVNSAQTVEIFTGNPDWDAVLAFTQKMAFSLFFGPGKHLPNPSFVLNRQMDQGYSLRGDGSDYSHLWSGQSALESYYLASLLPGAPELAAGLVRNFLAVQAENGSVDWKPGLAGQRGRWLAAPLLSSLAWWTFQHTGDLGFLREVQPGLQAFLECWFTPVHDRDGDGFPEWDHPLQAGLEESPPFTVWLPGGQGAQISCTENPALGAMLYREAGALASITSELHLPPEGNLAGLRLRQLGDLVEECWNPKTVLYHNRDRDTHLSPIGHRIGSRRGAGNSVLDKTFPHPVRLLIRIEINTDDTRRVQVHLQGQMGDLTQEEVFERSEFQWGSGLAVATSRQVYTRVTVLLVTGLVRGDRVSLHSMDLSGEDLSLLLPLWAGIPNQARAMDMFQKTLSAPDRFGKPFGLPACPSPASSTTTPACEFVQMPWNHLIGEGLLGYGLQREAADLVVRLMSAVIQNLKQQHAFARSYLAQDGTGQGERDSVYGLAPLGLFLDTLGVQITPTGQVILYGKNPFPWPVTVKYRGLTVTRQADQTLIDFPDGRTITMADPSHVMVSAE